MGEPPVGIEPTTPSLPWRCSATELQGRRGYVPRRVNDSQGPGASCLRSPGFRTSSVPSADADPTRRAGRRRGHPRPSTTSRCSRAPTPSTWCPVPGPSRRPGSSSTAGSTPPSWPSSPRIRRRRAGSGPTARSSSASAPSRPSASAPGTRPRPRTPSTSTGPSGARGVGKALLAELLVLASAHGFHSVIARIAGHNETSIGLHEAAGFELVGVEREVGRKHRQWLDVVELQRLL